MTQEERQAVRALIDQRRRELAQVKADDCGDLASETRYTSGCRCESCRKAQNAARAARRLPERVKTHGNGGYTGGCRCDICRQGMRAYKQARRARATA